MIEAKAPSGLSMGDVVHEFFADEPPGWLALVVGRPEKPPKGPINLGSGLRIVDLDEFIETTVRDLVTFVSARNRGSYHWVDRVLDEKVGQLELCGVTAEVRAIQ